MMFRNNSNNKIIRSFKTLSTCALNRNTIRRFSTQPTEIEGESGNEIKGINSKTHPSLYYREKWDLHKENYSDLSNIDVSLTEDKVIEGKENEKKDLDKDEDEIDLREMEDLEYQTMLTELEDLILDTLPPLFPYIKYEIYDLHKADPEFWDIKRLSQAFKIHPGRIVAIIRFIEIEKMEKANGTYDEEMNVVLSDYGYDVGYRMDDSADDFCEDEHQKQSKDDPNYYSPIGHNAHTLNRAYKTSTTKSKSRNINGRPDPIHEIPTQIPESYPDKPLYFRGPTFVVPRKKNVVFVDTSRNAITKKVNPDPMVLIQGIDGSLRTPSSTEKASIMQKVRPQKVRRDYESILNTPIKYKLQQKIKPVVKETPSEELQEQQQ
ncbi:hypothetical protein DICPUDRAFT_150816 [Dictyostelium purpureum]|uniref:Uncharacterized protein n=1 Tax=Dictyostelium purpureum TaxID=5786 RepID=F0ZHB7_DICPU|nr:uncharacterized protein DICPUDRAFT_150816 [Dictyostelium purpureum]EGC36641.1 hypothetical protein DICPUDRAFT_150816 [Dictyostelium purpureum]|eukprot:XP_003286809.1 hypothetical protein DICPUDRAFT_150816 [Dictyostelium purpureum]